MNRLQEKYTKEVVPSLKEKFGHKNNLAVPHLKKVVINVGTGKGIKDAKFLENVKNTLTRITGQRPIEAKAKKSISNFKIRQGMTVGSKVTLRGEKMYDFLDKMINVAMPRVRDFRGISSSVVDRRGNLTVGFKEHIIFPEIKSDEVENVHGLEVTIVTNAKNKEEGLELFKLLGFPFKTS